MASALSNLKAKRQEKASRASKRAKDESERAARHSDDSDRDTAYQRDKRRRTESHDDEAIQPQIESKRNEEVPSSHQIHFLSMS